jgi:hypothetical protein
MNVRHTGCHDGMRSSGKKRDNIENDVMTKMSNKEMLPCGDMKT